jgi:DNA-binding NarL/FixJ family response regulator
MRSVSKRMQPEGREAGEAHGVSGRYGLSNREMTVLGLLAEGLSDKEVSRHLQVSIYTVNKHVTSILTKMNAPSRTAAAVRAIREKLLSDEPQARPRMRDQGGADFRDGSRDRPSA